MYRDDKEIHWVHCTLSDAYLCLEGKARQRRPWPPCAICSFDRISSNPLTGRTRRAQPKGNLLIRSGNGGFEGIPRNLSIASTGSTSVTESPASTKVLPSDLNLGLISTDCLPSAMRPPTADPERRLIRGRSRQPWSHIVSATIFSFVADDQVTRELTVRCARQEHVDAGNLSSATPFAPSPRIHKRHTLFITEM
jgi:hypothetical protein